MQGYFVSYLRYPKSSCEHFIAAYLELSKKAFLYEALGYLLSSTAIGVSSTSGEVIKKFYQNLFMGIELY